MSWKKNRRKNDDPPLQESPKKSHGKFSAKDLSRSGFIEVRPGVFEKPGPQARRPLQNRGPQTPRVERHPKKKRERKSVPKGTGKKKDQSGRRFQLVIVSYRARSIDPTNCCGKYIEDFLVEKGILPEDDAYTCEAPVIRQVISTEAEQRTEIYLFEILPDNDPYKGDIL